MSRRAIFLPVLLALIVAMAAACSGGSQAGGAPGGNAANGQKLFTSGKGSAPPCSGCHSVTAGQVLVGPSLSGIATQAAQQLKDPNYKGQAKTAEDRIRECIVSPNTYVVPGFQPNVMYANYGKDLTSSDIDDLVAYLTTLK
jgi:nitric oxide reductase subunit C